MHLPSGNEVKLTCYHGWEAYVQNVLLSFKLRKSMHDWLQIYNLTYFKFDRLLRGMSRFIFPLYIIFYKIIPWKMSYSFPFDGRDVYLDYYDYPPQFYLELANAFEFSNMPSNRTFIEYGCINEIAKDIDAISALSTSEGRKEKAKRKTKQTQLNFLTGLIFYRAKGKNNLEKAFSLYSFAAERNYLPAIIKVSEMCQLGIGTERNQALANEWFNKGINEVKRLAEMGDIEMIKVLVNYYQSKGETDLAQYWARHIS